MATARHRRSASCQGRSVAAASTVTETGGRPGGAGIRRQKAARGSAEGVRPREQSGAAKPAPPPGPPGAPGARRRPNHPDTLARARRRTDGPAAGGVWVQNWVQDRASSRGQSASRWRDELLTDADQFPGVNAQRLGTVTLAELGSRTRTALWRKGLIFLSFLAGRSKGHHPGLPPNPDQLGGNLDGNSWTGGADGSATAHRSRPVLPRKVADDPW